MKKISGNVSSTDGPLAPGVVAAGILPAVEPGLQPGGQNHSQVRKAANFSKDRRDITVFSGRQGCRPLRQAGCLTLPATGLPDVPTNKLKCKYVIPSPSRVSQGEISPKNSRIDSINQDAPFLPRRGNHFSLSPGERAGVKVSVKLIIPSTSTCHCGALLPPFDLAVHGEGERIANPYGPFYVATLLNH
jgi:hypothetical protein